MEDEIKQDDFNDQPAIQVDLEKSTEKPGEKQDVSTNSTGKDQDPLREARTWAKRMEYQARQFEREARETQALKKELQEIKSMLRPQMNQELDEVDRVAATNWKDGVKMVVNPEIDRRVEEKLAEKQREIEVQQRRIEREQVLEQSRNYVRKYYPDIDNPNSDVARLYTSVMNENPHVLRDVYGPITAMKLMEDKVRASNASFNQSDNVRKSRAQAGSLPSGRSIKSNTYTLTQDQKALADHMGIPYDKYARTAKRLESGEGIEA